MKNSIKLLSLLIVLITTSLMAAPAKAETMGFLIKSSYDYSLRLEFYSPQRQLYWPGNNRSWLLDDYEAHTYKVNCRRGEQVCYGAWEPNGTLQWGVGYRHAQSCTNCCYVCTGGTTTKLINLTGN